MQVLAQNPLRNTPVGVSDASDAESWTFSRSKKLLTCGYLVSMVPAVIFKGGAGCPFSPGAWAWQAPELSCRTLTHNDKSDRSPSQKHCNMTQYYIIIAMMTNPKESKFLVRQLYGKWCPCKIMLISRWCRMALLSRVLCNWTTGHHPELICMPS